MLRSWVMVRHSSALLFLLCAVPALAWGPEGHRLVARLAEVRLTPATQARVTAILGPGITLTSAASWADDIRPSRKETEPWHYINVPISRPHLDMARDCPSGNCVVAKITEFREVMRDPATSAGRRREALLFVTHLVGDMHQPLHCGDDGDQGGNQVRVQFLGRRMNLHRLWDSALLDRMPPEDELFASLSRAISPERAAKWSRGSVEDWAEESFQAARETAYGRLPNLRKGATARLGEAYERIAGPVVELQLEKAGVRLAAVLNELP